MRDGDHYIVNGIKAWTTLGQYADWIFCLVRTNPTGKKQQGISFLLIDMKSPGVSVHPVITMEGDHEVNETHFEDVRVPVENRIGDENHFLADTVCTPVSAFETRLHAVVSFRSRIPGAVLAPIVKPLALRVFQQDAVILEKQTEIIERFGGEQFASTEIDVLGKHIWRLLRSAERGDTAPPEEETEVSLIV